MKFQLLPDLRCPESGRPLELQPVEAIRDGQVLSRIQHASLEPSDDVRLGVLIEPTHARAYPIVESIAVLLSRGDADVRQMDGMLARLGTVTAAATQAAIRETRLALRAADSTEEGQWNRDEMRYYDAAVSTEGKRAQMEEILRTVPDWRTFLPRRDAILREVQDKNYGQRVVELGCGTARTISWMYPPEENNYEYVGLDISFDRLRVARRLIPTGSFIQASALNVPIAREAMAVVLVFGALHHLPDQDRALEEACRVLRPGGLLGFHEPISKPPILPVTWEWMRRPFTSYEHSTHDGVIDLPSIHLTLQDLGLKRVREDLAISPLRTLVDVLFLRLAPKCLQSLTLIRAIQAVDKMILETLGRRFPRWGPHAVSTLVEKRT